MVTSKKRIRLVLLALVFVASPLGACDDAAEDRKDEDAPVCTAAASCNLGGWAPSVGGEVAGHCREYGGTGWSAETVQATCPESVGSYLDGCCPVTGAVAKCIVAPGTFNQWVDFYYADRGWTLTEAESICQSTNTGDNEFVVLDDDPPPTSSSSTASTGSGPHSASCVSVCGQITGDCSAIAPEDCLDECETDEANAASCDQAAEWQLMLDCCGAVADYTPYCAETRFDPCQSGACAELRPSGAAAGCE